MSLNSKCSITGGSGATGPKIKGCILSIFKRVSNMEYGMGSYHIWNEDTISSCHENALYYIQTLRVGLLPFFNSSTDFFQQDNAPIHNTRITLEFLEENNIVLLKWPASSPDMSIRKYVKYCEIND